ncbi:MAG: energy transducer TonB [Pseudomonadota bacterium]
MAKLISWDASEVTCNNGVTFGANSIPRRIPIRTSRPPQAQPRVIYDFALGEEGRALSMVASMGGRGRTFGVDLEPALAAARFTPQKAVTQCQVTFTQTITPYDEASLADLITLVIHSRRAPVPKDTWPRFVEGDCFASRARQLERHTPDYRKLPKRPGANNWVMISYNIDEDGAPFGIETVGGNGEPKLEAASKKALSDSRWVDEDPRTGCWRYDFTAADVIPAPEAPDLAQFGEWPDACEADDRWAKAPKLAYPKHYQRRGIEGWAIFRYDVASWGQIGNIELLDAQPTKELGEAAKRVLSSALYKKTQGGLTGCIEKVVFRLPEKGAGRPEGAE